MTNHQNFWRGVVKADAVLNPVDRISEVLFGTIMVLTFTGAISAATDGRQEIGELLWAALGCNVAWGFVDAIMYLMNVVLERAHNLTLINRITASESKLESRQAFREEIQPLLAGLLKDEEVDQITERLKSLQPPSKRHLITGKDLMAGVEIFFLVFLCTLPVALPFALFQDVEFAMRVSNGVALLILFIGGFILAGYAGFRRLTTAAIYVIIGVILVSLTMALGG